MPISRLVKYGLLSSAIFLGSTIAVQAQSDLPGCADQQVKDVVIEIMVESFQEETRYSTEKLLVDTGREWNPNSFNVIHIILADYNEHTGALTCNATLRGKRDREMWERVWINYKGMNITKARQRNLERGYWEEQDLNYLEYSVSQSAEDPEYFIVSVSY